MKNLDAKDNREQEGRNKTADYGLTIVIPVYNEEGNMLRLEKELSDFLKNARLSSCVLLVNDGSRDQSGPLMKEICSRQPGFYYLELAQNGGLSAALKAGIDQCDSQYIGYIDADLQTSPADFNLLLEHIQEYELVMGIRTARKDGVIKSLSSRIANRFRRMITRDGVEDTGCPLKVIHTDFAKRVPFFSGMHRFLPALIQLQQGKVMQIPVRHYPRMAGKSKYNLLNRLIGPLKDCFAFRWMKKRYIHYEIAEANI